MTVIVIDGPEKAGKTTLVNALATLARERRVEFATRKWGKLDGSRFAADHVYAAALAKDSAKPGVVVWDRSWASEAVYGQLLARDRRLAVDPWLGEWLYGRAVPLRYILPGPDPAVLSAARTDDDLPVDPAREQAAFLEYGRTYGWRPLPHRTCPEASPTVLASLILNDAMHFRAWSPEVYCGAPRSSVVFVGTRAPSRSAQPGAWLPFTSANESYFGYALGPVALKIGWTNAYDEPVDIFDHASCIVACGRAADAWVRGELEQRAEYQSTQIVDVPHPSTLYRKEYLADLIVPTENTIRAVAARYFPTTVRLQETIESVTVTTR